MKALIVEKERRTMPILETVGNVFSFKEVSSASDAKTMIATGDYRMIILDCKVPGLECLSLLKEMRERELSAGNSNEGLSASPYIIVIDCPDDEAAVNVFLNAGADDVYRGPICGYELKKSINIAHRILSLRDYLAQVYSQMMEAERTAAIGRLIPGIAHEMNNPLGFIDSNLSVLTDYCHDLCEAVDDNDTPPRRNDLSGMEPGQGKININKIMSDIFPLLGECREGIERMKKMIRDLQQVSSSDIDQRVDLDINNCLDETLNVLWNELKYKVVINKSYSHLSSVSGYPGRIHYLFLHLLHKAAFSVKGMGVIDITTSNGNGYVSVMITGKKSSENNRPPMENIPSVLHSCNVKDDSARELLAIRKIVQAHDGLLEIEPLKDVGTIFRVRFPAKQF